MYCECCLQRLSGAVCGAHVWDDRRPAWRLSQVVHVARLPVSARRRGIGLELQIWSRPLFCLVGVLWRRARSPSDVFTRRAPLLTAVDRCRRLWDEGGLGGGGGIAVRAGSVSVSLLSEPTSETHQQAGRTPRRAVRSAFHVLGYVSLR